jgi:signal transduction histidine kinase
VLVVQDRGIGIEPQHLPRLFERFERGSNTAGYTGLGLGLWIAKKMVEAHGGRIEVESAPNAGSTFTVTLPKTIPGKEAAG